MKHGVLLMLVVGPLLAQAGTPVQPDAKTEIPPVVYQEELDPATPIFVQIEAVRNTDGSVDLDRLPTLVRRALTTDAAKGSCHELLPPIPEIGASYRPSLDRALARISHQK